MLKGLLLANLRRESHERRFGCKMCDWKMTEVVLVPRILLEVFEVFRIKIDQILDTKPISAHAYSKRFPSSYARFLNDCYENNSSLPKSNTT